MNNFARLIITLSLYCGYLSGFCEDKSDITLQTLQWAERFAAQTLTKNSIINDIGIRRRTLREREEDYRNFKTLFYKGYITDKQLESVALQVEEAGVDLKSRRLDLELIEGEIEITNRRVELSCGIEPTSIEDIIKFAKIYADRWEKRLTILNPRIEIARKKKIMSKEYYDWILMMYKKGYESKVALRDAAVELFRYETDLNTLIGELEVRKDFIEELKLLADELPPS